MASGLTWITSGSKALKNSLEKQQARFGLPKLFSSICHVNTEQAIAFFDNSRAQETQRHKKLTILQHKYSLTAKFKPYSRAFT
ncbi:hypothetical protein EV682_105105 [Iodobacter fluviatilis]|uniref:Uncharacterized protein n=1 Tax=Iodobacter fluviatilis TaxID=537 RepID=A0A377Q8X7_9NEIS|nr:hypothetical protein EV682_105105 [Iodobacter fluviatilis]STQ90311.1 Uncharacterised protein [Iodobacter fluviatilis]